MRIPIVQGQQCTYLHIHAWEYCGKLPKQPTFVRRWEDTGTYDKRYFKVKQPTFVRRWEAENASSLKLAEKETTYVCT